MVNVVAEAYVHVSFAATHQSCRSAVVAIFTPSMATTQADTLVKVVSLACHNSILPTQIAVLVEGTNQAIGNPVALVSVPDAGVPSAHPETNIFAHSIAKTHADTLVIVLSDACPSSIDPTQIAVDVEATSPAIGNPVQLVSVPDEGVPSTGVVSVGEVSVLLVRVSVFAMRETVPVALGNVNVLFVVASHETLNIASVHHWFNENNDAQVINENAGVSIAASVSLNSRYE